MAALPRGMTHVSREELYTSLPVRIDYLCTFLEFGPDDIDALRDGHRYIKTVIPAVVNMVYKKLLTHDVTARTFSTRDSRSEEDPEQWPTENTTQIQHRKMFLRWYLTKLNSDPSKMEYWEYLDKVGLMHVGRGRRNPLHVDFVFLNACMAYIQDAIFEAILSHPTLPLPRKIAIVKAVGKVIWIQNDLLAKWHVRDGDGYDDGSDEAETAAAAAGDKEGFLHGKQVLGGGNGSGSGSSANPSDDDASVRSGGSGKTSLGRDLKDVGRPPSSPAGGEGFGRCPFSGMGTGAGDQRAAPPMPTGRGRREDTEMCTERKNGVPKLVVEEGRVRGTHALKGDFLA